MPPNYRGLLAIIPPAVLRALTSQSAVLRFSRAAILAGLLPVCMFHPVVLPCNENPKQPGCERQNSVSSTAAKDSRDEVSCAPSTQMHA